MRTSTITFLETSVKLMGLQFLTFTLSDNGCSICLSPGIRNPLQSPQPFNDDRQQLHDDAS